MWRQSWLYDSDMCSICCMYKQADAQTEIVALKFHQCDLGKSANSLIWPKEPLGQPGFHTSTLICLFGPHWVILLHCSAKDEPISHKELYLENTSQFLHSLKDRLLFKWTANFLQQQMRTFLSDVQLSLLKTVFFQSKGRVLWIRLLACQPIAVASVGV